MGYDVRTGAIFGICFPVSGLSDHPDINWEEGFDDESVNLNDSSTFEDLDDYEIEEIRVGKLIKVAKGLGLDVDCDVDGEQSSTDAIYVGISLTHASASRIIEATNRFKQVCTPDVIQQFADIIGREPQVYEPYNFNLDEPTKYTREPMMYATFDKCW